MRRYKQQFRRSSDKLDPNSAQAMFVCMQMEILKAAIDQLCKAPLEPRKPVKRKKIA
jgi:hypothetical protein